MSKIIDYLESDFWLSPISVPLYWPMQFFANEIIPRSKDLKSWFFFNILRRKPSMKFKIEEFMIQPANVCNAHCIFCVLSKNKVACQEKIMPMTLFETALDEIEKEGRKAMNLTPTVGEILIDPNIFNKIRLAKSRGFVVHSYSNGILLSANENYKRLVDSGIDRIVISISDVEPDIEAKTFSIPVILAQQKLEGIKKLLEYNHKKHGIKEIYLSFRQTRHPHKIVTHPFFKQLRKYSFKYNFILRWDSWGGVIKQKDLNKYMRIATMRKFRRYPCLSTNILSVLPSGSVRVCSCRVIDNIEDDLVVGNLHQESLKEIIKSGRIEKIKMRFQNKKYLAICKDCVFYRSEY